MHFHLGVYLDHQYILSKTEDVLMSTNEKIMNV